MITKIIKSKIAEAFILKIESLANIDYKFRDPWLDIRILNFLMHSYLSYEQCFDGRER